MLSAAVVALMLAAQAEPQVAPAAPATPAAKPAKICKTVKITGTRVNSRRMCATKAEWDRIARDMQDDVRESQNQSKMGSNQ